MSITVVGSVALDTIETLFGKMERGLGGAAMHFSVAASFFTDINLIGVVGGDFPQEHIDFMKKRNIDLTGLQVEMEGKTFHWIGRYDEDVNSAITLETHLNVFETFKPVVPDKYKNPDFLFLANIHPDLQLHVIANAGKPKMIAMDTMNLWIDITKDILKKVIQKVDLVCINDQEVKMLTGNNNLVCGAREIQNMGPKTVIVKRGEYGAVLFHEEKIFAAPALPIEEVKDPTGAGDTFAGGMMGYLDQCPEVTFDHLKTAIICGSVMASFNVEEFGCNRLRKLTKDDISKRFADFQALGQFDSMSL
ncbi:MAG: PfkB family carbohydrate kinase [bacterium]|nr:sugar kinase [bacterium]MBU1916801.1 sugar kinase [bacterium]